ncbi:MAG: membrane dipeptidase [Planctomycetes bacterium]|nr:membrane dipeptidase [Planctomycetota bacterium]
MEEPIRLSDAAAALIAERPVFDAHADSLQRALDLGHDLAVAGPGHLDLERGAAGGLGALVFVSWVDPKFHEQGPGGALARTRDLLGAFHELAQRRPDRVRFAGNARALAEARSHRAVAGIPGIEGGHSIEESLDNLEWFFERGVRVMTLVWNNHLSWIRSCQAGAGSTIPEGLSDFGRLVVRTMNELGMVVDLSHAGERSFYDTLDATKKPVIASHSGCKALHGHQRNLTDDQLRALAANGGVVGIVFCTAFLDADAQQHDTATRKHAELAAITGPNETDVFLRQSEYMQRATPPLAMERVMDHIYHAIDVAGLEHVGLGSDYDGIQRTPRGLEHAGCYGRIAEHMLARGFCAADVRKVLGGNMERVFAAVTGLGSAAHDAPLVPLVSSNARGDCT